MDVSRVGTNSVLLAFLAVTLVCTVLASSEPSPSMLGVGSALGVCNDSAVLRGLPWVVKFYCYARVLANPWIVSGLATVVSALGIAHATHPVLVKRIASFGTTLVLVLGWLVVAWIVCWWQLVGMTQHT